MKVKFCVVGIAVVTLALMQTGIWAQTTLEQYRQIVIAPKASAKVKAAAEELQYHLQAIAGRDIPIITQNPSGDSLSFFVGGGMVGQQQDAVEKMPVEGWLIKSVDGGILLASEEKGATPRNPSPYHSVSLFLEKYCNVRWIWPGKTGEIIPRNPRLVFPTLNDTGVPQFKRREFLYTYRNAFSPQAIQEYDQWVGRARLGNQFNANFAHAWETLIPEDLYFEKHPEWFSLVNGKRISAQLCISNMELRTELVKRLLSLPMNQRFDIVSVSANDGYGFCECELCKAKGTIGDSYWDFINDVALRVKKERPGLGVGTFAYSFSRDAPKKIKRLPDNVYLSMEIQASSLMTEEGRQTYRKYIDGWRDKGVKIVMREYWGVHYFLDLPVLFPDEIAQSIKIAIEGGLVGAYGETSKSWATQAPNYYMATHMLWDPAADPKAVLDEFYATFGPAEAQVRAYYSLLNKALRSRLKEHSRGIYAERVALYGEIFNRELMTRAGQLLQEAQGKAAGDAALKSRIAVLQAGCEYTTVMGELLSLYSKLGHTGFPLEFFEWEATAATRRQAINSVDVNRISDDLPYFEKRLKQPISYTLADKDAWLVRAWELGEERTRIFNKYRNLPAINEGLYAWTIVSPNRNWHQAVTKALGKKLEDNVQLEFTQKK